MLLNLNGVRKTYFIRNNELPILKGITISIEENEFVAFMGPSGSGKTTLLHLMGALDHPTSGSIVIDGIDISHLDDVGLARIRNESLGFVFQNFYLLSYYTALENVCLPLIYAGNLNEKKESAENLLEQVGLKERIHHKPNELSGGERQRVAIARALINEPKILFADEPTGNLDSKTGDAILELLHNINEKGTTVVLITHDPRIADHATRVLHVQDGLVT